MNWATIGRFFTNSSCRPVQVRETAVHCYSQDGDEWHFLICDPNDGSTQANKSHCFCAKSEDFLASEAQPKKALVNPPPNLEMNAKNHESTHITEHEAHTMLHFYNFTNNFI
jgi:hypothetical protein